MAVHLHTDCDRNDIRFPRPLEWPIDRMSLLYIIMSTVKFIIIADGFEKFSENIHAAAHINEVVLFGGTSSGFERISHVIVRVALESHACCKALQVTR